MEYCLSKYNLFINFKEDVIVYNTASTSLCVISQNEYKELLDGNYCNLDLIRLLAEGIIIDNSSDEDKVLDEMIYNSVNNCNCRNIRILTTTNCNARCAYCFEEGIKKENLSEETGLEICNYIERTANKNEVVKISWFGGEPLLNINAIESITKRLQTIEESKGIRFKYSMVTNGSLITNDVVQKMVRDLKIYNVQITLDGFRDKYNEIKRYVNGDVYNFDTVISSINHLIENKINVSIRINYTEENYDSVMELIHFLGERYSNIKNIKVYVFPVWNVNDGGEYLYWSKEKLFSVYKKLVECSLCTLEEIANLKIKKTQCMAWNKYSFAVLPSGDLVKCTQKTERIIGNISSGIIDEIEENRWSNSELSPECKICVYRPVCQGGCRASEFGNMKKCFATKPIFEKLLCWYVEEKLKVLNE